MIFLSHSSRDNERLTYLIKEIETKGIEIWFDQNEIPPGASITREMDKALASCDRLLVAWSQFAEQSFHVRNELEAFYFKKPQPDNILFVQLDGTALPTLFAARKCINLSNDPARDVTNIVGWINGQQSEIIQEMKEEFPTPAVLRQFPRGPMVKGYWVTPALVTAYAAIPRPQAISLLSEANRLRLEADPNDPHVTVVRSDFLPELGQVDAFDYWQKAFREACLNGPRMLAALLLVQPDDLFEPAVRKDRAKLLQHLRSLAPTPR